MTIALGILSGTSQILAADTQMSTDSEKLSQGKLHYFWDAPTAGSPAGCITITGAGDEFNLKALQFELSAIFSKNKTESMDDLQIVFSKTLNRFYREYIAITPNVEQRPEVELLIAARRGNHSGMWTTKRNKVSPSSGAAVGIGATYAQSILGNLSLYPNPNSVAMLVAAYIVFLVKLRNLWVGLDTQVVCVDDSLRPFPLVWNTPVCRRLEEFFRAYVGIEARLLYQAFGSDYIVCEMANISDEVTAIRRSLAGFISPISPLSPQPTTGDQSAQPPLPE
jgi:hypothetical protein